MKKPNKRRPDRARYVWLARGELVTTRSREWQDWLLWMKGHQSQYKLAIRHS